ncbi:MAG: hypothetical protein CL916_01180 [Deltaproteobacteria bacterium]|nr:hypothetical protein [Deltaproteobacteria bacterium]
MDIPKELQGQPWSAILWDDVQQYAHNIDTHLSFSDHPVIIDVGGNIGAAALLFHLRYKAKVLSIEAIVETYAQLKNNCSSYSNITTIHQAIGATTENITLYRYPLAPGLGGLDSSRGHIWYVLSMQVAHKISWTSIKDILMMPFRVMGTILWSFFALLIVWTRKKQQVAQRTLSNVIDIHLDEMNIDLVKIDIEGHELKALQGLRSEHWKRIQAFIMEVHPQHVHEVLELLNQHGFSIVSRESALLHGEKIPEILIANKKT